MIFFSTETMHLKFYTHFTILQKSWLMKMNKKYRVHYSKFILLTLIDTYVRYLCAL